MRELFLSKHMEDDTNSTLYFQQDRFDMEEYKARMQSLRVKKDVSFESRDVDINNFIISPEGMEGLILSIYIIIIPYITGAIVLFLFVAGSDIEKFLIMDLTTFFIVWAIGYEVVAAFILSAIFYSYLKYMGCCGMSENTPEPRKRSRR